MNLESLIQKRDVANAELSACRKRLNALIQEHGKTVTELAQREGQVITLNGLVAELSPNPEPVKDAPKPDQVTAPDLKLLKKPAKKK